jgi:hypothetical protein
LPQECLHPPTEDWIGDWFLSEDYIVIRIYGFDKPPYRLPTFLTPRIFAMEIIRQRFHVDLQHFSSKKHASSIKLPITIGPFTVKSKEVINLIDDIMASFKFPIDVACQYDPYHLIANKKKKLKRGTYQHQGTEEMDKTANLLSYPPNLLQIEPTQNMDIDIGNTSKDKGKRKQDEDLIMTDSQATPTKKPREMKNLLVKVK